MRRTTIVAPEELLCQLESIAKREHVSLAEVIRQGLELRVAEDRRPLRFIASARSSEKPHNTARESSEIQFEPPPWR